MERAKERMDTRYESIVVEQNQTKWDECQSA